MTTAARLAFAMIGALGLLSGCSGGDAEGPGGAAGSGGTGGTPICGDLIGYGGTMQGTWRAQPAQEHALAAPNYPGGGILVVRLECDVAEAELEILIDGQEGVVAKDGPANETEVAFESAPSQPYFIRALLDSPGANSPPIDYLITWQFLVRPDCYEQNDIPDQAATITIGEEVEAYLIQSRGSVDHEPSRTLDPIVIKADEHVDWYRFTVVDSSILTVDIFELPTDVTTRFRLHNDLANAIPGAEWIQAEGETSGSLVLPPLPGGDYFLSVSALEFDENSESSVGGATHPDHFDTPYRFQVNVSTIPANRMCYPPTSFTRSVANRWLNADDVKIEQITAPADPGGGIFVLWVVSPEVPPGIQVKVAGAPENSPSVAGDNPANGETKVAFETGPAQSFNARITVANAPASRSFPHDYQFFWTFEPRLDCYEPNDLVSEAAVIAIDDDVRAYVVQKRGSPGHASAEHYDWYTFTLPTSGPLELEIMSLPTRSGLNFRIHDAGLVRVNGGTWRQTEGVSSGVLMIPMLTAGNYFLSVTSGGFGDGAKWESNGSGDPRPDHFETPYEFRLSVP